MPFDSGDIRLKPQLSGATPPPEQEHLPCPRCDSTNTKFCYYNNYNFSQPRHFCKSCRRYWTHGGTLRDIPIGGGSRKNAKRSRTISSVNSGTSVHNHHPLPAPNAAIFVSISASQFGNSCSGASAGAGDVKSGGSFTSLLNTPGPGFLALGGFGLGIGSGYEDIGFGRGVWSFPVVEGVGVINGGGGGGNILVNPWQIESGESGFVDGDCFSSWPDLAISTPGNGLK